MYSLKSLNGEIVRIRAKMFKKYFLFFYFFIFLIYKVAVVVASFYVIY